MSLGRKRKRIKKIDWFFSLLLFVPLSLSLKGCALHGSLAPEACPEDTRLEMVEVSAGPSRGQGIIWYRDEDGCVILTPAHLVGAGDVRVIWPDGSVRDSRRTKIVESVDVAFVWLETGDIPEELLGQCKGPVTAPGLEEGQKVILKSLDEAGEPWEEELEVKDPWIDTEAFGQYMLLTTGSAEEGMSGALLVDREGRMAGMLCGMQENEEGNTLAFVPIQVILSQWTIQSIQNRE